VNGLKVARLGDKIACANGEAEIVANVAKNITVDGKPIAHLGSVSSHAGQIISGSPNVFITEREVIDLHVLLK
ncbi:MAG: PAAR domain-containing protein, partial [Bacteroidota bacterium]